MEEVENSSSSITHLLCFLSHKGRSSLFHNPMDCGEVRAFDGGECGTIVQVAHSTQQKLALSMLVVEPPFHFSPIYSF